MDTTLQSTQFLPKQIQHAIEEVGRIDFPEEYSTAQNVVIGAMGGSLFPYYVITSLFSEQLTVPLIAANGYLLPSFVDKNTLFLGSSYSGTTEETIHTTTMAFDKNALISGITTGAALGDFFISKKVPFYHITPTYNPSGQPRIAVGYMIFGVVCLLQKLGYLKISVDRLSKAAQDLEEIDSQILQKATMFEKKISDAILIYVAAEHLAGVAHTIRNQTNETAKSFAEYNLIPELNHHLMEGLAFPKNNNVEFIFLTSALYSPRVQKRMELTQEVIKKQNEKVITISMEARTQLDEFLQFLQFGSYLTYTRSKTNHVDPSKIPWVDYFKEKMT